ncbi:PhnD/SsuA/transferrin family substrate-binding protein [Streptomyces sp. NPDC090306]|uniref:PhnD/SsuA/transferrin family substrate-binding protein n=1 Tax=Streptomyces sp. NPDC090306 TaxID=3365961 RepID=UPI00381B5B66
MAAHPVSIVVSDRPHTAALRSVRSLDGTLTVFPSVSPLYRAFAQMIADARYDICEMAVGAFLQARAAGRQLLLLPVVIGGGFHHGSVVVSPAAPPGGPAGLRGRRVGVRSYSQTTGLWVRAFLEEEHGIRPEDVTWVTTEGSHVPEYQDPPFTRRTSRTLREELLDGGVVAAVPGRGDGAGLSTLVEDPAGAARAWHARHGVVPVNHLLVTTETFAAERPALIAEVMALVGEGIDATRPPGTGGPALPSGLVHGRAAVLPTVALAARYAVRQGLVPELPDVEALFVPQL